MPRFVANPKDPAAVNKLQNVTRAADYIGLPLITIAAIAVAVFANSVVKLTFGEIERQYGEKVYAFSAIAVLFAMVTVALILMAKVRGAIVKFCIRKEVANLAIFAVNPVLVRACQTHLMVMSRKKKLVRSVPLAMLYQWHFGELEFIARNAKEANNFAGSGK
jgi:hypothetical protein